MKHGFRFGERTRHTWLQQPLRCTLQRCSEYPPLREEIFENLEGMEDNIKKISEE
jgi:hypothetical protein